MNCHFCAWQHTYIDTTDMSDVKEAIHAQGAEPQSMTPDQFGNLLKTDYQKWKGIVQASGATIE